MEKIFEKILASKKYKNFNEDFVKRVIEINVSKEDSLKSTKRMLHELSYMYNNLDRINELSLIWEFVCKNINDGKNIKRVLDLGCGKDYMFFKQDKSIEYSGVDIFKNEEVICDDILDPKKNWIDKKYDVVLMLNLIPVLEKIEKNSGTRILNEMLGISKYVVISFPMMSLSGKNYIGHYWKKYIHDNFPNGLIKDLGKEIVIIVKGNAKQ